jgi:hypothetical protein
VLGAKRYPQRVNLDDVRHLAAEELDAALTSLGLQSGWDLGDHIQRAAIHYPREVCLPEPAARPVEAFRNLVVGRIAERVFRAQHLAPLEAEGFAVRDYHEKGENRDYAVLRDGLELPINVKVASTRFREAQRVVALEPDDCIPVGAYKAIGASERVSDLVYVFLVDFSLREKVDAFMEELDGPLAIAWHLLSWYAGRGAKRVQDGFTDALFNQHEDVLMALVPGVTSYRVISAQRVLAIMRDLPRRVPGLGVKAAGRGVFQAEVNVHVSVRQETRPWDDVADQLRRYGIQPILDQIRHTASAVIPAPLL